MTNFSAGAFSSLWVHIGTVVNAGLQNHGLVKLEGSSKAIESSPWQATESKLNARTKEKPSWSKPKADVNSGEAV